MFKTVFRLVILVFIFSLQIVRSYTQPYKIVLPQGHSQGISKIKYSADGKWIATASQDGSAKLWDAETGQLLVTYIGHKKQVHDIFFLQNGKKIITTSGYSMGDGTTKVWDTYTGKLLYSLPKFFRNSTLIHYKPKCSFSMFPIIH